MLKEAQFGDRSFEGALVPAYFIRYNDKYFPILPRKFSGILIDKWSDLFSKYGFFSIKSGEFSYQKKLSLQVAKFLQDRFWKRNFYPIVSAIQSDGRPHELTFSGYILS
jgi:hypothetical protein